MTKKVEKKTAKKPAEKAAKPKTAKPKPRPRPKKPGTDLVIDGISASTTVRQHADIASRTIDGQEIVVVPASRKLQILNEVATRVWALCDGRSVGEIAQAIVSEYEVDVETASRDVIELVVDMKAKGMVETA